MAMLNIPSYNSDPNYRYRMPRLVSKVEGRGNGIKTNIMNMADIARAIKRPPEYPSKFCGHELGAQSKFDSAEGKSIVNGAHETKELQQLIDKFIDKYVLCPNCSLPEIDLVLKKGIVSCHCNACGHSTQLDNAHKIATFMVRNPPKGTESTMGKKSQSKTDRRDKKRGKGEDGVEEAGEDKDKKKKKKDKSKSHKKKAKGEDDDEDEEGEDEECDDGDEAMDGDAKDGETGSKSSKKKKKGSKISTAELVMAKERLSYDSPEIRDVRNRMVAFAYEQLGGEGGDDDSNLHIRVAPDAFFTEMRVLQVSQDFDAVVRLFVALEVLFCQRRSGVAVSTGDGDATVGADAEQSLSIDADGVVQKLSFLKKVVDTSMDTTKICAAFEDFISLRAPQSMSNYPFILHKLYLYEMVGETDLIHRYASAGLTEEQKTSKAAAKAAKGAVTYPVNPAAREVVQPFIEWLQEAEDEDASSEEDDPQPSTAVSRPSATGSGTGTGSPASSAKMCDEETDSK